MKVRVVELFAGVGGFRLALDERAGGFETVWFNQWEPSTKAQHAFDCYRARFHDGALVDPIHNQDIAKVPAGQIPDHDLLVGGFPCQDYSVAATLDKSGGLEGKKGVLWWEISRILDHHRPSYVLLENVDRLLRSPAQQRGRDFAILLACLRDLGYVVEWRVINAADYGFPQKRRRVFIFGAMEDTNLGHQLAASAPGNGHLTETGFFAPAFPTVHNAAAVVGERPASLTLPDDVRRISDHFDHHFQNAGAMVKGHVWTQRVEPRKEPLTPLSSVLSPCVDEAFFIPPDAIDGPKGWRWFRSAKNELRISKTGHEYRYAEGAMAFPDPTDQPARTILTGEGGTGPSRSKHAVQDPANGRLRTLTPEECEQLNGFPAGWTEMLPPRWRYFTMGNALVVGVVERIGCRLNEAIDQATADTAAPRRVASA